MLYIMNVGFFQDNNIGLTRRPNYIGSYLIFVYVDIKLPKLMCGSFFFLGGGLSFMVPKKKMCVFPSKIVVSRYVLSRNEQHLLFVLIKQSLYKTWSKLLLF